MSNGDHFLIETIDETETEIGEDYTGLEADNIPRALTLPAGCDPSTTYEGVEVACTTRL